jgi:hypothetical protein
MMAVPTGFLDLPREFRQMILYHSFDAALQQDIALCTNLKLLELITYPRPFLRVKLEATQNRVLKPCGSSAPHIRTWATTLNSLCETISDGLPFVVDHLLESFEEKVGSAFVKDKDVFFEKLARWFDLWVDRDCTSSQRIHSILLADTPGIHL